jgi:protein TonB
MKVGQASYLLAAVALHAAVLWGVRIAPPPIISTAEEGEHVEVDLIAAPEPAVEQPPAPTPPPPEPPPPPLEPTPIPEPQPVPPPEPKPKPKPSAPAPATKPAEIPRNRVPTKPAPASSIPGIAAGKPVGPDRAHATFRHRVEPPYPDAARQSGLAGRVVVQISISPAGEVIGARVTTSSGNPALDEAAVRAARASTYWPKTIAGTPLSDTVLVPYNFRLGTR